MEFTDGRIKHYYLIKILESCALHLHEACEQLDDNRFENIAFFAKQASDGLKEDLTKLH